MASFDCPGCEVPMEERVTLPIGWTKRDPLPENLTVHYEGYSGTGRKFAIEGDSWSNKRIFLDGVL